MIYLEIITNFSWSQMITSVVIPLTFVLTLITFIINTYERMRKNRREELELYLKVKSDIYTDKSKELNRSIREKNLYTKIENGIMYLYTKDTEGKEKRLSSDLIDHLEDLYLIHSKDLITLGMINTGYGTTISNVYENEEIQKFIKYLRDKYKDKELYIGLEELYKSLKSDYSN